MKRRKIEFRGMPDIRGPARRTLVEVLRQLMTESRFGSLAELGAAIRPPLDKRRLSEFARGELPDAHELKAVGEACGWRDWPRLRQLLNAARAETTASHARGPVLPVVGEFHEWTRLGVHRPITRLSSGEDLSERVNAGELPAYVLREKDLEPRTGLRPVLAAMADGSGPPSGLVLITGESAAGKTRAAVEAMRAELGGWRLLNPYSADDLRRYLDDGLDLRHVVVWLDEVQDFLQTPVGIEQVRRLLASPTGPIVLLATLRTDAENMLRGTPGWRVLDGQAHRITLHRRLPQEKFERELNRAHDLQDPWIAEALSKIGSRYGIAEWLAAGPQLLRELDRARTSSDPIDGAAAAIVEAAIDCYRTGYTQPIPESLLAEAHRLYLPEHLGHPDMKSFSAGLARARRPVAGASGMLEHHRAWGDLPFDYLLGNTSGSDLSDVNQELWSILPMHVTKPTVRSIVRAAHRAGRESLSSLLISRCDPLTQVELYVEVGDIDELKHRKASGDHYATRWLNRLHDGEVNPEKIAGRDHIFDRPSLLTRVLADRGDIPSLSRLAETGDERAAKRLALLLDDADAMNDLYRLADLGDQRAAEQLAVLLAYGGDVSGLSRRADEGDQHAAFELASLLDRRGDLEELSRRADSGDRQAAELRASLLADRGDMDELAACADEGDRHAAVHLVSLLADRGNVDELAARANAGDQHAADHLAELRQLRGALDIAGN
ncbi:hypothetical protein [Pseudonocardia sp. DLS-67]